MIAFQVAASPFISARCQRPMWPELAAPHMKLTRGREFLVSREISAAWTGKVEDTMRKDEGCGIFNSGCQVVQF